MAPKSSDKCPYKRKAERNEIYREDNMKMEAETEVMQPQTKECLAPPEAGRDKESPLETS